MRFLSAVVVLALPHSGVLGAELSTRLHVEYKAPTISVEAHNMLVQDVLVAVGDQVGFKTISIGEINSFVLHLSLKDGSVEEVLDTLLGGRNYAVSHHPALGQPEYGIDKVFVLGAPEREGAVTSRVVTMGGHYPISTQDSPLSLKELRTRHQEVFNQWRKNRSLNAQHEQNQQEPLNGDPNVVRQQQQEVEKARGVFDTLTQANQIQPMHGRATPPSNLARSNSELEQDLESFHDVLMEMTNQRQQ